MNAGAGANLKKRKRDFLYRTEPKRTKHRNYYVHKGRLPKHIAYNYIIIISIIIRSMSRDN